MYYDLDWWSLSPPAYPHHPKCRNRMGLEVPPVQGVVKVVVRWVAFVRELGKVLVAPVG